MKMPLLPSKAEIKVELRLAAKLVWPTILSNVATLGLPLVNVVFVGHIGQAELGAAALASMIVNCCWSGAVGLLCAIDTLASQAHGAGNAYKVAVILQRGMLISAVYALPVAALWWFSAPVLRALGQTEDVVRLSSLYCRVLIPAAIPAYWKEALFRALVATGIVVPQLIVGAVSVALIAFLDWMLIVVAGLGFVGAPIALGCVWIAQGPLLLLVLRITAWISDCRQRQQQQQQQHRVAIHWLWPLHKEALRRWGEFLKLALPGVLMIAAEWVAWEICAIFAGAIGEAQLGAYSVNYNLQGLCFMVPLTLGVVASTRVGNNLGAGRPVMARFAAIACVGTTIVAQLIYLSILFLSRNYAGYIFTNAPGVLVEVARTLPLVIVVEFFDGLQGACSGVLRGCGNQAFGGICNVIFYYVVGVPVAAFLVFGVSRSLLLVYCGVCLSVVFQSTAFISKIVFTNWTALSKQVVERERGAAAAAAVSASQPSESPSTTTTSSTITPELGDIVLQSPADSAMISMSIPEDDDDEDDGSMPLVISTKDQPEELEN